MTEAIGIDVGGTKLVAAVVDREGRARDRRRLRTPAPRDGAADGTAIVRVVVDLVEELGADLPVGVAVAALVGEDGRLAYAPNLAVRDLALGELLRASLGRTVSVLNDATAAGVAEQRVGAGRGHDDVVLVTIGTGVGGSVVTGGHLVVGAHGHGTELGHVIVDADGPPCACGNRGCLEAVASGTALERMARDGLVDPTVTSTLRGLDRIDGRDVTDAASDGDAYAIAVIEEAGRWLGIGLAGFVNVFDPTRVIVGGGAADGAGPWLLPAARTSMQAHVEGAAHRRLPDVVPAELGDDAGLIGAALTALETA